MDKYGIDCIFMNNNHECDLGNDTFECLKNCSDQISYDTLDEQNHTAE